MLRLGASPSVSKSLSAGVPRKRRPKEVTGIAPNGQSDSERPQVRMAMGCRGRLRVGPLGHAAYRPDPAGELARRGAVGHRGPLAARRRSRRDWPRWARAAAPPRASRARRKAWAATRTSRHESSARTRGDAPRPPGPRLRAKGAPRTGERNVRHADHQRRARLSLFGYSDHRGSFTHLFCGGAIRRNLNSPIRSRVAREVGLARRLGRVNSDAAALCRLVATMPESIPAA